MAIRESVAHEVQKLFSSIAAPVLDKHFLKNRDGDVMILRKKVCSVWTEKECSVKAPELAWAVLESLPEWAAKSVRQEINGKWGIKTKGIAYYGEIIRKAFEYMDGASVTLMESIVVSPLFKSGDIVYFPPTKGKRK